MQEETGVRLSTVVRVETKHPESFQSVMFRQKALDDFFALFYITLLFVFKVQITSVFYPVYRVIPLLENELTSKKQPHCICNHTPFSALM